MDKYITVTRSKTGCMKTQKQKQRFNPYDGVSKYDQSKAQIRDQRKETEE